MLKDLYPDDFECSKCGKTPEYNAVMTRKYSVRRLEFPYFLCGDCRICSYSKQLLRYWISRWIKDNHRAQVPYIQIYREAKEILEETLKYYMNTAGYRLGRFKKKPIR